MANYRSRFLSAMVANERAMARLFRDLATAIAADVTRRADADGLVPRTATFDLQRLAGERVQRLFLGVSRSGELAPYELAVGGKLVPLSPYMVALWDAITAVVRLPVEQNAAILTRRLPPDVLAVMRLGTIDPFRAAKTKVTEVEIFRPNPLARYDAPHTWVDPRGYRLSDRIWNVTATERQRLNLYLDTAIREGKGALAMAKELEQFLDPSRSGLKTSKPYGSKASFDAMRLARSEISRAHQEAGRVAAAMNPFVAGKKWNLSPRHPKPDICDQYARGGPNGDGVYSLDAYPGRPHPQCICYDTNVLIGDPDAVIEALRIDIRRERSLLVDQIGPLAVNEFDRLLLGETIPETALTARRVEAEAAKAAATVTGTVEPTAIQARTRLDRIFAEYETRIEAERAAYQAAWVEISPLYDQKADIVTAYLKAQTEADRVKLSVRERTLAAQIAALNAKRQVYLDNMGRLEGERGQAMREVVYVLEPATNTVSWSGRPQRATQDNWRSGMDAFNRLVRPEVWDRADVPIVRLPKGGRAYHQGGTIHITTDEEIGTMIHEIAHAFERQSGILPKVLAFYDRRTAGDPVEQLSTVTGVSAYGSNEVTRRDRWLHPYMGKDYKRTATELVSMGLEMMYDNPGRLAKDDPDMFDFLFDLVRGR